MYDINRLRKELISKPKQLALLNNLHCQIEKNHYAKRITIVLNPGEKYSSHIKKATIHLLGYKEVGKKLSNTFNIIKR